MSVYLDDAPVTIRNNGFYAGQTEPLFFDLAQSEVLRGPQGTLYGASAMGGTIRLVGNKVDLDHVSGSAYAELSGTLHGGLNDLARGVVNVPIVPGELGVRVGAQTLEDSGYVDHAGPGGGIDRGGINQDRSYVVRASALWQPPAELTIAPSAFVQHVNIGDTGLVDVATPNYAVNKLVQEGGRDSLAVYSLKGGYDLGWAQLTSVTSYARRQFPRTTDGTYFNSQFVGGFVDGLGLTGLDGGLDGYRLGALPGPVYNSIDTRQGTEEVRLVSKPYDPESLLPLTWIVGLYASDSNYLGRSSQYVNDFNSVFASVYGIPAESFLGTPIPNNLFYAFNNRLDDQEYAVFGEATLYVTPALRFTAGLRYLYGRDTETDVSSGFFASTPFASGTIRNYALTPKFALSYDIDADVTAYATAGKGFRLGGLNAPVPASQCAQDLAAFGIAAAPTSYAPDKLWNYEAGVKGRLLDDRLSVDASAFDIEWDRIQLDVPLKTCGFDFTDNVGHARSTGFEAEVLLRAAPGLTLGASGDYDHDAFTQDVPGLGVRTGDRVPGSPEYALGLSADYERELADDVVGFVRANWQFTGDSHGTIIRGNQDYKRPPYNILGASVGATFGRWEVSLFAKNLTDTRKIIQRPADNYVALGYTPVPFTAGVTAGMKF